MGSVPLVVQKETIHPRDMITCHGQGVKPESWQEINNIVSYDS